MNQYQQSVMIRNGSNVGDTDIFDRMELEASYRDDIRDLQEENKSLRETLDKQIALNERASEGLDRYQAIVEADTSYIADLEIESAHMDKIIFDQRDQIDALSDDLEAAYVVIEKLQNENENNLDKVRLQAVATYIRYIRYIGGVGLVEVQ